MKIELELLQQSEFPLVVEWINTHDQDFIYQWAGSTYRYPLTVEQMKAQYSQGINSIEAGVFIYKIVDSIDHEPMGTVQLGRIDFESGEAVVGRFVINSENRRGKGIGTEVLQELVRIGFEELSLSRIKLNVFDINARAIRCYEKVGFKQGTITENVYQSFKGEFWNAIEMTLDRDQWKKLLKA